MSILILKKRENIKKEILSCIKFGEFMQAKDNFIQFLNKDIQT